MPPVGKKPVLEVRKAEKDACRQMVLSCHYSGRCPGIKHCWGLFAEELLVGCVVYSVPASYTLCKGVCGPALKGHVLELSRLVITTARKNAASLLVGASLRELPDAVVVSYADCNEHVGHVGYVYQATNWLYTGQGGAEPVWCCPRTGKVVSFTRRHIDQKATKLGLDWRELVKRPQQGKHRYVFFTGSKKFRKTVRIQLKYPVLPYPKGPTQRHEGSVMNTVFHEEWHTSSQDQRSEDR